MSHKFDTSLGKNESTRIARPFSEIHTCISWFTLATVEYLRSLLGIIKYEGKCLITEYLYEKLSCNNVIIFIFTCVCDLQYIQIKNILTLP